MPPADPQSMALIPLPDFVHFPKTDLHLELAASDRALAEAIIAQSGQGALLGTTLLRPSWARAVGSTDLFSAGTAVALVEHGPTSEGGYAIVLHGEHRFELAERPRSLADGLLREARVRRIDEPFISDVDPRIVELRAELLGSLGSLAQGTDGFAIDRTQLAELDSSDIPFESLVNAVASALDLSPLRKQSLLADPLPDRARNLRGILRSRVSMMDLLAPFRHLAEHADRN